MDMWTEYGKQELPVRRKFDLAFNGTINGFEEMDDQGRSKSYLVKDGDKVILERIYDGGVPTESQVDLARTGRFNTLIQYDKMGVPVKISKIE